jgi:hypothetical protein
VIARIAPMLGLLPDTADMAAIQQQLYIPLQPAHGYVPPKLAPWPGEPLATAAPVAAAPAPASPSVAPVPASMPPRRTPEQMRHEAANGTALAAR